MKSSFSSTLFQFLLARHSVFNASNRCKQNDVTCHSIPRLQIYRYQIFKLGYVTATADVNSFQQVVPKIRSNLTWHSNMLTVKDLPKNNLRKSRRRPRERKKRERQQVQLFGQYFTELCHHNSMRCPYFSSENPWISMSA